MEWLRIIAFAAAWHLFATNGADVGVTQTLCSLSPIFILPFAVWLEKERIGFRAILGAAVAVCGSALLFM